MTDSKTREAFEAWFEGFEFDRAEYPARFSAWQAARRAALEEAAQACEDMHDEDRPGDYAYTIRALADETQEG